VNLRRMAVVIGVASINSTIAGAFEVDGFRTGMTRAQLVAEAKNRGLGGNGVNALPYRTSVLASWHVPFAASGIRRRVVSRQRAR
jgi:hypothetical protein